MPRRRNGPGVFLVSVGAVLAFGGLLTFAAIPAAARMDRKEAYQKEAPLTQERQRAMSRGAIGMTLGGAALAGLGLFWVRRTVGG